MFRIDKTYCLRVTAQIAFVNFFNLKTCMHKGGGKIKVKR